MSEWTDIGEQLKATREKSGLSLQDVSYKIRIPLGTLRALEENDYSGFPSPTYAKSFLGQYADYLNIDAHEWLDCFEAGNVLAHSDNLDYLVPDEESPSRPSRSRTRESSGNLGQTLLIFFITSGLIAGAVWGFIEIEKRINAENPETVDQPEQPEQQPETLKNLNQNGTPHENTPIVIPDITLQPKPGDPTKKPVLVTPEKKLTPPRAIIVEEDDD